MAYKIEPASEQNVDTPLTNFPVSEDYFDRMSDVSADLVSFVTQYNTFFQSGNMNECSRLLAENPDLKACFFNADKYNQLRDSIISMERFLLNQVDQLYNSVVQNAVGINDNPTPEQAAIVSYSAEKINRLHNQRQITLTADRWSDTYPYSQSVTAGGITADDHLKVIGVHHPSGSSPEQVKAANKAAACLLSNDSADATSDNTITFLAYKKPLTDFTVITEGG